MISLNIFLLIIFISSILIFYSLKLLVDYKKISNANFKKRKNLKRWGNSFKSHLGGLAFFFGFLIALFISFFFYDESIFSINLKILFLLILTCSLSLLDDILLLSAKVKIFIQILISINLIIFDFDVEFFKSDTNFNLILNSTPEFFDNEFRHYDSTRIYPERLTKIDDLKRAKKDPWWELRNDCGFCSTNYYYDRDIYCISLDVFQKIERVSHGYMSTETLRVKECSIKPFEGWAICVLDSVAERLSPTRLREKFVLKLICEALNLDEEDYETKPPLTTNNVGRPNISIAAAKSFMKHFSLDKKPSWKEAIAKIKEVDGLEVSVRTLQRGLKQLF